MTKAEAMAWFKSFMNEVDTQDNLCTAKPIQFQLQLKREYVADGDYGDSHKVFRHEDMEGSSFDTKKECIEWLKEYGYEGKKLKEKVEEIQELYVGHYWQTDQSFFTRKGYEDHYAINSHNLGEHRTYVVHAFRNQENQDLFKAIRAIIQEGEK